MNVTSIIVEADKRISQLKYIQTKTHRYKKYDTDIRAKAVCVIVEEKINEIESIKRMFKRNITDNFDYYAHKMRAMVVVLEIIFEHVALYEYNNYQYVNADINIDELINYLTIYPNETERIRRQYVIKGADYASVDMGIPGIL